MKTIKFKSIPEYWEKEYLNLKPNTIRMIEERDIRKEILDDWLNGKWNLIRIEIENTKTKEVFFREVQDVTKFEGYYIISWKPE